MVGPCQIRPQGLPLALEDRLARLCRPKFCHQGVEIPERAQGGELALVNIDHRKVLGRSQAGLQDASQKGMTHIAAADKNYFLVQHLAGFPPAGSSAPTILKGDRE